MKLRVCFLERNRILVRRISYHDSRYEIAARVQMRPVNLKKKKKLANKQYPAKNSEAQLTSVETIQATSWRLDPSVFKSVERLRISHFSYLYFAGNSSIFWRVEINVGRIKAKLRYIFLVCFFVCFCLCFFL